MTQKTDLREHFRMIRKQISLERRAFASQALVELLSKNPSTQILSFHSFGTEIELAPLNALFAQQGRLILPYVDNDILTLYLVKDLEGDLIKSSVGPFEPNPRKCKKVDLEQIDLVLVPGLVFDNQGYRIGYGKGHYDRLLAKMPHVQTVGVGFREQKHDDPLPRDSWDVPVHQLLLV